MSIFGRKAAGALQKGLLAAAIAVPAAAGAQQQTAVTQTSNPESGIKMGSARLNPTFEFETRYDSQAGFVREGADFKGVGDLILHIRPGLRFKAPSETLELSFKGNYDYQAYMGMEEDALTDQSKSAADLDFSALFNRDGNFRVELADKFVRSDRTSNLSTGINSISNRNDATVRLNFRSEGNWTVTPSYTLTSETFDAVSGGRDQRNISLYDYLAHTGRIDARYTVFGKSAIVLDGAISQRDYSAEAPEASILLREVGSAQVMVGLTGLLTQKIGYTAKVGYGTQFGLEDEREGFSSAVANAELAWFANQLTDVRVGYLRTFEADPVYSYYQDDRVYLNGTAQFGANTRVRAGLAVDTIGFGEVGNQTAEDTLFTLSISPEYAFNRFISGGLSYAFTQRSSDRDSAVISLYDFDRHELGARVMFIY